MYQGYIFKFNLYAYHAFVSQDVKNSAVHPHTWSIAVHIEFDNKFEQYFKIENIINQVLSDYQDKVLNEIPPFGELSPTLENLGDILFIKINERLKEHGVSTHLLEISETPSRIFCVTAESFDDIEEELLSSHTLNTMKSSIASSILETPTYKGEDEIMSLNIQGEKLDYNNDVYISSPIEEPKHIFIKSLLAFITIILVGIALIIYVNYKGHYPWGSDSFGHIFKSDLLYHNILNGNFYPLYTDKWYNGLQPFRYWAPVPYYLLAFLQFLAKGNAIGSYNIFIFFSFVAGSCGWLLWGIKEKRVYLSTFLGMLYFSMPDNIRVFFSEGNIPRIVIAMLLPYALYFIWQFVYYRKKSAILGVIILTALLSLCHLMITAMFGISVFIFMLFYSMINRVFKESYQVLIGMLCGIALCGVWLYPALKGGVISLDSAATLEVMKALTFPFTQSLNPGWRFSNIEIYYFGLSFLCVTVFGLFASTKKCIPGFLTIIVIFLGTTTAFVPFLIKLPLSQLLWMMRFTPIAYAVFILSMLLWKNIKRLTLFILMLFVLIDSMASFKLLAYNSVPSPDIINMFDISAQNTSQRIAILDNSEFGSLPSYYIATEKQLPYAYGWAWQGASTAQNIVLLNTALEREDYPYMFDRSLELGCDTVLVKKDKVKDSQKLFDCAGLIGYNLIHEFNNGYLFKINAPEHFGMMTKYYGLAIGKSAGDIVLKYPSFQIADNDYLDEYSEQELMQYETVYVSGFLYHDRNAAENLLLKIAEKGVKIIIDMNRVPNDPITNRLYFMGVTAQPISFDNKLPDVHLKDRVFFPIKFKEEFKKWNTVYLENVPVIEGFSWFGGNKIAFFGKHTNPNISFVGFNIFFHAIVNEDQGMIDAYTEIIGQPTTRMPKRTIVPINIEIDKNRINITSDVEYYNTTLAFLDAFKSDQDIYSVHNLLNAKEKDVSIKIIYPYLKDGIVVSIAGLVFTLLFLIFIVFKKSNNKRIKL